MVHILSQLPFLNQRKGENDSRKDFMINLNERMLPDRSRDQKLLYFVWKFMYIYISQGAGTYGVIFVKTTKKMK